MIKQILLEGLKVPLHIVLHLQPKHQQEAVGKELTAA